MEDWIPYDGGRTIGTGGSEGGVIEVDVSHPAGARLTAERCGAPETRHWAITCGVYGCFFHTCLATPSADPPLKLMKRMAAAIENIARSSGGADERRDLIDSFVHDLSVEASLQSAVFWRSIPAGAYGHGTFPHCAMYPQEPHDPQ